MERRCRCARKALPWYPRSSRIIIALLALLASSPTGYLLWSLVTVTGTAVPLTLQDSHSKQGTEFRELGICFLSSLGISLRLPLGMPNSANKTLIIISPAHLYHEPDRR